LFSGGPWAARLFAGVIFTVSVIALADQPTTIPMEQTPSTAQSTEPSDIPHFKMKDGKPSEEFFEMHQSFLNRKSAGPIDLLFLGDSITDFWRRPAPAGGKEIWDQYFGKLNAANFGINGDKTQQLLWRIDHGELDGLHPKVVVLLIGTNNCAYTVDEMERGIKKIIDRIHEKLPNSKLLIVGIFPRGADPSSKTPESKTGSPISTLRAKIKIVNEYLSTFDDGRQTRFLDFGEKFLVKGEKISADLMPDGLHPSAKGYRIFAGCMAPILAEMMH
jgi:beta-glucosidase